MDKSRALKYLNDVHADLDTVDNDFYRSLAAIDRFDLKNTDLVLNAHVIRNDLAVLIDNLSLLIADHDTQ